MRAYLTQLPTLAWLAMLLPVLVIARQVTVAVGPAILRAVVPHSVCVLLRIL